MVIPVEDEVVRKSARFSLYRPCYDSNGTLVSQHVKIYDGPKANRNTGRKSFASLSMV